MPPSVTLGYKSTLKALRSGKAKLVIIAGNTPPLRKSELEYYSMLAKTNVHHFNGNNVRLLSFSHTQPPAQRLAFGLVGHSLCEEVSDQTLESNLLADLLSSYRSSSVPLAVSSSVAPPWPSLMLVTPTSSLPRLLKSIV